MITINQLQSLVWGGKVETLSLPAPGSGLAKVRFMVSESCTKYSEATVNGIQAPGDNKAVIFVEKDPGPNSVNDVLRNSTEGDVTRCVRALQADDDWSDMMLMKLAVGTGKEGRVVDRIKQGKTARGVSESQNHWTLDSDRLTCGSIISSSSASQTSTMQ